MQRSALELLPSPVLMVHAGLLTQPISLMSRIQCRSHLDLLGHSPLRFWRCSGFGGCVCVCVSRCASSGLAWVRLPSVVRRYFGALHFGAFFDSQPAATAARRRRPPGDSTRQQRPTRYQPRAEGRSATHRRRRSLRVAPSSSLSAASTPRADAGAALFVRRITRPRAGRRDRPLSQLAAVGQRARLAHPLPPPCNSHSRQCHGGSSSRRRGAIGGSGAIRRRPTQRRCLPPPVGPRTPQAQLRHDRSHVDRRSGTEARQRRRLAVSRPTARLRAPVEATPTTDSLGRAPPTGRHSSNSK